MTDQEIIKFLKHEGLYDGRPELTEAANRFELLLAALRTIDNMIPKDTANLSVMEIMAGDVAEGALNGTWPAFGIMPRAAKMNEVCDVATD